MIDARTVNMIRRANPLAEVLQRLYGLELKRDGAGRWKCLCPFHTEKVPSFTVFERDNVFKCFGCGQRGDIFAFAMKRDGLTFPQAVEKFAARAGVSRSTDNKSAKRKIVATYDYRDEGGALLFQVERTDPKGFRQRTPDGKGGWLYKVDGVRRVLYRLPEVLKAAGQIWIVEGEKDADTLAGLGFTATTNPGGAGKWRDEFNEVLRGKPVVIVPDNDATGLNHAEQVARALNGVAANVKMLRLPENAKDVSDFIASFTDKIEAAERLAVMAEQTGEHKPIEQPKTDARPVLVFRSPSEWRDYQPPENAVLVGDCHITRGNVVVIGGAPGVGKSRASVALAVAGATGADWFGLKVHRRFKTLILQNENGGLRLHDEFSELDCDALDGFCRVCEPPEYGIRFNAEDFCAALKAELDAFGPDVLVVDPWNACVSDDKQRDYLETFRAIRAVIPAGETSPALVIVAHTRKPRGGDHRPSGRELLHELAGSYGLGSVPRTVFVMQAASADMEDDRIVWTCCKANDAREPGGRSAWQRRNSLFVPVTDFDWREFDKPASERVTITETDMAEVFQHGNRSLARKQAVAELEELTGCKAAACYKALKLTGKFAKHLSEDNGLLRWTP